MPSLQVAAASDLPGRSFYCRTCARTGDGRVPHECVGLARRIPVPNCAEQWRQLTEAVQNHIPQARRTVAQGAAHLGVLRTQQQGV